jgi:8-oxo-dGTP diphosphatase
MSGDLPAEFASYQHIAVAVISNNRGDVLISQRHSSAIHGGFWEFPGGKVEPGELVEQALQRELTEELGIEVRRMRQLIRLPYSYPEHNVFLDVWCVDEFEGEPSGLEGQPIRWVAREQLSKYKFPEANSRIIGAINLADYLLITPDPGEEAQWPVFLSHLKQRLYGSAATLMVILRAKSLNSRQYQELAQQVASICSEQQVVLQLTEVSDLPSVGLHLTSAQLRAAPTNLCEAVGSLSASCHDLAELKLAERLGVDFALLSPVLATMTHPDATPLGWQQFQKCVDQVAIPVYALGGMTPADLGMAHQHGAQGVAAIRALWEFD